MKTIAPVKKSGADTAAEVILPAERKAGWISFGDKVVLIYFKGNLPFVRSGKISSTASSHCGIDNVTETIIWGDQPFNSLADNADDAHERSVKINCPLLLHYEEALILRDLEKAMKWYEGVYPESVIRGIAEALRNFDYQAEEFHC